MDALGSLDSLKAELPEATWEALNFEQTQFANGSVYHDPFYTADVGTESKPPGTLFKVERDTDPSKYSLPPGTALSRFTYQSKDLKGEPVPVSAYVLWPYSPRSLPDGYQVVAWAHGTSGLAPNTAPSHLKNLWQHYLAPFPLALQGYVVIGTDYAGLGISKRADGTFIPHECKGDPSLCLLEIELHRDFHSIIVDLFDTPHSRYFLPCTWTLNHAPDTCSFDPPQTYAIRPPPARCS